MMHELDPIDTEELKKNLYEKRPADVELSAESNWGFLKYLYSVI